MKEQSRDTTKTWVLLLASVASLMAALDAMVVTTALGTIRVDLGASIEALEWSVGFISAIGASAALSLMAAIDALALPGKRISHREAKANA
jgi:hypothetical protein